MAKQFGVKWVLIWLKAGVNGVRKIK
jgi:hypothetical protein